MFGFDLKIYNIAEYEQEPAGRQEYLCGRGNCRDENGHTRLHHFVLDQKRDLALLQQIIDTGVHLYIPNMKGKTVLLLAVVHRQKGVVEKLIENGADVHTVDTFENNALHYMALPELNHYFDHLEDKSYINDTLPLLQLLLNAGVDVNLRNKRLETPLMWACRGYHVEIVEMLLNNGAELTLNHSFQSCLLNASTLNPVNALGWDGMNADIITKIIIKGDNLNGFNIHGRTPLGCIIRSKHQFKYYVAKEFIKVAVLAHWSRRIEFLESRKRAVGWFKAERFLIEYADECYAEIDRMKSVWLSEEGSNLCHFALRGASTTVSNDQESGEALKILVHQNFPVYHSLILKSFNIEYLRRRFVELNFVRTVEGRDIALIPELKYKIAKLLRTKDIIVAFQAFRFPKN